MVHLAPRLLQNVVDFVLDGLVDLALPRIILGDLSVALTHAMQVLGARRVERLL